MVEPQDIKAIRKAVRENDCRDYIIKQLRKTFGGKTRYGGYAHVFVPNDKDFVVKIICRDDDWAYSNYIRYAKRVGHKYSVLPVVYDSFKTDDFEVFVLEKLKHDVRKSYKFSRTHFNETVWGCEVKTPRSDPLYPVMKKIQYLTTASIGQAFDAFDSNIMVRSNGTLVITDPIG